MFPVLGVDPGQHLVPQPLQRTRAECLPPRAGNRRGRHLVRALPRHQRQVAEQRGHDLGVVCVRHQRHQQREPDRQGRGQRPARCSFYLAVQQDSPGDLIDHAGAAAQLIQPLLGQPKPGVIGRVPASLYPAVAAHHCGRDRRRLEEHHQVPGGDPARPGHGQRRAAILSQPRARCRTQVSGPDRDHACLAQQFQASRRGRTAGTRS